MTNKLFLATLAAAVALPAMVYTAPVDAAAKSFSDIPKTHPHAAKIEFLVSSGVIAGFTDGTFRPATKVTRGQYAAFISRALNLPEPATVKTFSDVSPRVSTYDGIIKATAAGIVSGYKNGQFKPSEYISRGEMAIMLDRALQLKPGFSKKSTLSTYSDAGSIGLTSLDAVQRLTYYKIMGPLSDKKFSPETDGDRMQTVLSIYQLLEAQKATADGGEAGGSPGGNTDNGSGGEEKYPAGDLRNATYEELKQEVGTWEVWRRMAGGQYDGMVYKDDLVKMMYEDINGGTLSEENLKVSPEAFFNLRFKGIVENAYSPYVQAYPHYEILSVNGVPFRDTEWFPEKFKNPQYYALEIIANVIPEAPKEKGKFLIDIPTANLDVATYEPSSVKTSKLSKLVEKTPDGQDYYVDTVGMFAGTDVVTVTNGGKSIKYGNKLLELVPGSNQAKLNGTTITLSNPVKTGTNTTYIPFKAVVKAFGMDYRQMDLAQRFEVTNYETDNTQVGWEE